MYTDPPPAANKSETLRIVNSAFMLVHMLVTTCPYAGSRYNCCMLPVALSKEEGGGVDDVARDEENFRSGLRRNIAQLSNLARVNKEELARLRDQVPQRVRFSAYFSNAGKE